MKLSLLLILVLSLSACASPIPLRPFEKRTYDWCRKFKIEKPEGKLCYRYCDKTAWYSTKKCLHYTIIVEDLVDTETYNRFENSEKKVGKTIDL